MFNDVFWFSSALVIVGPAALLAATMVTSRYHAATGEAARARP